MRFAGLQSPIALLLWRSNSMCIYCNTSQYRKIFENHHGSIPVDQTGRKYEIHHKDGNHNNNDPSNLVALTIQEHLNAHHIRGDWAACFRIAQRMKLSPEEIREYARKRTEKQLQQGIHNFQREDVKNKTKARLAEQYSLGIHPFQDRERARARAIARVQNGTHNLLDREAASKRSKARVANGTCNLVGGSQQRKMLAEGKHPSQITQICPHCQKSGKASAMKRWHFDKCPKNPTGIASSQSCPHCGKQGRANLKRYHFDNCKFKCD